MLAQVPHCVDPALHTSISQRTTSLDRNSLLMAWTLAPRLILCLTSCRVAYTTICQREVTFSADCKLTAAIPESWAWLVDCKTRIACGRVSIITHYLIRAFVINISQQQCLLLGIVWITLSPPLSLAMTYKATLKAGVVVSAVAPHSRFSCCYDLLCIHVAQVLPILYQ